MKQAKVMTEINSDDIRTDKKKARIKRRSLLKAGAMAAPLAITLYGGISLAHADSTDCVEQLEKNVEVPHFDASGNKDGKESFNPETGFTGRTIGGKPETHWDYITKEDKTGASCLQSIQSSKGSDAVEFHSDPDSGHHSHSD